MRAIADFKKANFGSGPDWRPDYWNVDVAPHFEADERADVFATLPWPDGTFEEILASDILEHTSWMHTERVLGEWLRVLAPGGRLTIRVPDFRHLCSQYVAGELDARTASLWIYGGHEAHLGAEHWRLNAHYAGFDEDRLRALMAALGVDVESLTRESTNLLLVAKKV